MAHRTQACHRPTTNRLRRQHHTDLATGKPYAANNPSRTKPTFPRASTLPNNPQASNLTGKAVPKPHPNQAVKPAALTRPAAASKGANRAADPARGFTKDSGSTGG